MEAGREGGRGGQLGRRGGRGGGDLEDRCSFLRTVSWPASVRVFQGCLRSVPSNADALPKLSSGRPAGVGLRGCVRSTGKRQTKTNSAPMKLRYVSAPIQPHRVHGPCSANTAGTMGNS